MGIRSWWESLTVDGERVPNEAEAAARVGFINGYTFPETVIERFRDAHPELDHGEVLLVEDATRQWFRLLARDARPGDMPSTAVDHLWREFAEHARYLDKFCPPAFGRHQPHRPAIIVISRVTDRRDEMKRSLHSAQDDERLTDRRRLPLLFRVDETVGIDGGRAYDYCNKRGYCSAPSDAVCIRHRIDIPKGESWGGGQVSQPTGGF